MSLAPPAPRGVGANMIGELDVRAIILSGLHELANDPENLDLIVRRADELLQGSQESWSQQLRGELLAMLDPRSDRYVQVQVGYPLPNAHLPWVSLVLDDAGENDAESVVGDVEAVSYETFGTFVPPKSLPSGVSIEPLPDPTQNQGQNPRIERVTTTGTGWKTTIQIGCWHVAPEGSLLLQTAVRWALFRGKLTGAGVHQVDFAEGGVHPDPKIHPRVGYVPMIRATLLWTYTQRIREAAVPGRITVTSLPYC